MLSAEAITGKYAEALREKGGLRAALQKYGILRLMDVAVREAWETLGMRVLAALGRCPEKGYGWLEALFSPTCDYWSRYAPVIAAIDRIAPVKVPRIMEVASGGRGGISWAVGKKKVEVCLVDRSEHLVRDPLGGKALRVCGDGCRLPFGDSSFDVTVSLDTVEHLPPALRPAFLSELKRIARYGVVLTCPLESGDGVFQAREFDKLLSDIITKQKGVQPGWLQEHLQQGHPKKDELLELLPEAQVTGSENCTVWIRFAALYQRLFIWPLAGLYYVIFLRKKDVGPPYRRALLVWEKQAIIGGQTGAQAETSVNATGPELRN